MGPNWAPGGPMGPNGAPLGPWGPWGRRTSGETSGEPPANPPKLVFGSQKGRLECALRRTFLIFCILGIFSNDFWIWCHFRSFFDFWGVLGPSLQHCGFCQAQESLLSHFWVTFESLCELAQKVTLKSLLNILQNRHPGGLLVF